MGVYLMNLKHTGMSTGTGKADSGGTERRMGNSGRSGLRYLLAHQFTDDAGRVSAYKSFLIGKRPGGTYNFRGRFMGGLGSGPQVYSGNVIQRNHTLILAQTPHGGKEAA
jgi:hypothetical protein